MRSLKSTASLFGSMVMTCVLFLLITCVNAAPLSLEARGRGPQLCGRVLKHSNYRDMCLGLYVYDPVVNKGRTLTNPVQMQPGLAFSNYRNFEDHLTWLEPNQMSQLKTNLGSRFSEVHCDHVLEVQYISSMLAKASTGICRKVRSNTENANVLNDLVKIVNGEDNLLLLDGEVNKLKARYTTRVMTATSKSKKSGEKVNPVLPELDDTWLLNGVAFYFTQIRERQLKVAGDIYDLLSGLAEEELGDRESFLSQVRDDYETLNEFFQKLFFEHPNSDGWMPALLHGSSNGNNQLSAEEEDKLDSELQASFKLEDDDDQEPLSQRQIEHLESHARLAASTLSPPRILRSGRSQCRRSMDSNTDSSDGPACELPARPGVPNRPVNNETNENLTSEIGILPASNPTSVLLASTATVAQEIRSSDFIQESSVSLLGIHSSRPPLGNLNSPTSRMSTFVTQQRSQSFASPTLSSLLRQSSIAHIPSHLPTTPVYTRPTSTRVRTGGRSTVANRTGPKSTKKASLLHLF